MNEVGLSKGDMVIVSAENKPYIALTQGSVEELSIDSVTLVLDRSVHPERMAWKPAANCHLSSISRCTTQTVSNHKTCIAPLWVLSLPVCYNKPPS